MIDRTARVNQIIHDYTLVIISEMRGYDTGEVARWIVETNHDYDPNVASEYATISSRLIDFQTALREADK